MSSTELTHYYQLCTVANGGHEHPAKKLTREALQEIFGKKAMGVYFAESDTEFITAERVVGGAETETKVNKNIETKTKANMDVAANTIVVYL